jgi:hypothetical protein
MPKNCKNSTWTKFLAKIIAFGILCSVTRFLKKLFGRCLLIISLFRNIPRLKPAKIFLSGKNKMDGQQRFTKLQKLKIIVLKTICSDCIQNKIKNLVIYKQTHETSRFWRNQHQFMLFLLMLARWMWLVVLHMTF